MMTGKYLAEVLSNDLITIYDEPRRYLGLRMLTFSEERTHPDEAAYHEFTIVGVDAQAYPYAVGSRLLVECGEDDQGQLQLGRIKVLVAIAQSEG